MDGAGEGLRCTECRMRELLLVPPVVDEGEQRELESLATARVVKREA